MKRLVLSFLFLCYATVANAAGSAVTVNSNIVLPIPKDTYKIYHIDFTTDAADGTVTLPIGTIHGDVIMAVTQPGTHGGAAPTTGWDITLTDEDGIDIMTGSLLNRTTVVETAQPVASGLPIRRPTHSTVTLNITNAGNTRTGTILLYVANY